MKRDIGQDHSELERLSSGTAGKAGAASADDPVPSGDAARSASIPFEPRFEERHGVRYLRLDFVGLSPNDLPAALAKASAVIHAEPVGSLRIFTTLDTRFNEVGAEALKRYLAGNKPFVKASAVVTRGFWYVVMTSVKLAKRRDIELFTDEVAALEWLAQQ